MLPAPPTAYFVAWYVLPFQYRAHLVLVQLSRMLRAPLTAKEKKSRKPQVPKNARSQGS